MLFRGLLLGIAAIAWLGVVAAVAETAPDAPAPHETAPEVDPTPAPGDGDVVVLKTGRRLTGVRVVRETPRAIEIESAPGMPLFSIPRSQVDRVIRDPLAGERDETPESRPEPTPDVLRGQEVSPELHRKLTAPLNDTPREFPIQDFIQTLETLAAEVEVPLSFTEDVRAIPPQQRVWRLEVEPGQSLLNVLQDDLLPDFPDIRWRVHESDAIEIKTAEEAG